VGKLRHKDIWAGIDRLAAKSGYSPSGLARRAGLDPTSFNISKRINPQGKPRWPTTESLAKILSLTDKSLADFVALIGKRAGAGVGRRYPVTSLSKAATKGHYNEAGVPSGSGWRDLEGPDLGEDAAYALEITGNNLHPVYRRGDIIILAPTTSAKRGDRVIVGTRGGDVILREIVRQNKRQLELRPVNTETSDAPIATGDVLWMHRVMWTQQ
jgi:phage repressor protein C with HTH and peptisase S24 domain